MIGIILQIIAVYAVIALIGLLLLVFLPKGWLVQEYPKEWEEAEDRELERKFKEYEDKKSQE